MRALLHDSTAARVGALFQLLVQDTTAQDFRPTQLGHPVEDVTPDRNFSPLCLAVPRLQAASEHGLVSEEACSQRAPAVGSPDSFCYSRRPTWRILSRAVSRCAHGPSVGPADSAERRGGITITTFSVPAALARS